MKFKSSKEKVRVVVAADASQPDSNRLEQLPAISSSGEAGQSADVRLPVQNSSSSTNEFDTVDQGGSRHTSKAKSWLPVSSLLVLLAILFAVFGTLVNRVEWKKATADGIAAASRLNYNKSEKMLKKALEASQRIPFNDKMVATSLSNLGELYRVCGELSKDEELQHEALKLRLKLYGKDGIEVASSLFNLAVLYEDREELDKARQYYRAALAIQRSHNAGPDLQKTLLAFAKRLKRDGNVDEAEQLLFESLKLHLGAADRDDSNIEEVLGILQILGTTPAERCRIGERLLGMFEDSKKVSASRMMGVLTSAASVSVDDAKARSYFDRARELALQTIDGESARFDLSFQAPFKLQAAMMFDIQRGCDPRRGYEPQSARKIEQASFESRGSNSGLPQNLAFYRKELMLLRSKFGSAHPSLAAVYADLAECVQLSPEERLRHAMTAVSLIEGHLRHVGKRDGQISSILAVDIAEMFRSAAGASPDPAKIVEKEIQFFQNYGITDPFAVSMLCDQISSGIDRQRQEQLCNQLFPLVRQIFTDVRYDDVEPFGVVCQIYESIKRCASPRQELALKSLYLARFQRIFGSEHPKVAIAYIELANCSLASLAERESWCRKALSIYSKNLHTCNATFCDGFQVTSAFNVLEQIHSDTKSIIQYRKECVEFWKRAPKRFANQLACALHNLARLEALPRPERDAHFAAALDSWINFFADKPPARMFFSGFEIDGLFCDWARLHGAANANEILKKEIAFWTRLDSSCPGSSALFSQGTRSGAEQLKRLTAITSLMVSDKQLSLPMMRRGLLSWCALAHEGDPELLRQGLRNWEIILRSQREECAIAYATLGKVSCFPDAERLQYLERAMSIWEKDYKFPEVTREQIEESFRYIKLVSGRTDTAERELQFWRCRNNNCAMPLTMARANYKLAFELQQQNWEGDSKNVSAVNNRCAAIYRAVLKSCFDALSENSDYANENEEIFSLLAGISSPEQGEVYLKRAVEVRGFVQSHQRLRVLARLGCFYASQGRIDKAKELYKAVIENEFLSPQFRGRASKDLSELVLAYQATRGNQHDASPVSSGAYVQLLQSQIKRYWFPSSYEFNTTRNVVVVFHIDPRGRISKVKVRQSSGSTVFDRLGVEAVERAAPFLPCRGGHDFEHTFSTKWPGN